MQFPVLNTVFNPAHCKHSNAGLKAASPHHDSDVKVVCGRPVSREEGCDGGCAACYNAARLASNGQHIACAVGVKALQATAFRQD
eukprot:1162144-Pelagomonas_calceolata.AAC.2